MPDWQLPPGVPRGLYDQMRDADAAAAYDGSLAGTPLLEQDLDFFRRHCPQPGRLLDLGAGSGRLAIPMAQAGFQVTAVDLSAPMLRVLGGKAQAANVNVDRLVANIVELEALWDQSFDYVACLFSSLGLVSGRENRLRALQHAARLLRPGGKLILHVHNRWFHLWTRFGRRLLLLNWWRSLRGKEERGDFRMPGQGDIVMHLFTKREVKRLLSAVGLRPVELRAISPEAASLRCSWCLGRLRAYGFLIAAQKRARGNDLPRPRDVAT